MTTFAGAARDATDGRGVAAVFDGVGAATFGRSLEAIRPRGVLVVYGAASGAPPLVDIGRLNSDGSLYVTRPSIVHYTATTDELRARARDVFTQVSKGQLIPTSQWFAIGQVRAAFTALEARQTTGKVVLARQMRGCRPADGHRRDHRHQRGSSASHRELGRPST